MIVAYLVNQYPHVSHTFIRREIAALERRGLTIRRFSVRPAPRDLVDPSDRVEVSKTTVILAAGFPFLFIAMLTMLVTRPIRFCKSLATTINLGRRSERGIVRHLVYLIEACWLHRQLKDVKHLHAHFGTNSATVALLCYKLGGPSYSFTVHGPEEFDRPDALSLSDKIHHAKFVVAISFFGCSQLYRWSRSEDWPKIHVVRCALDADYLAVQTTPVPVTHQFMCIGRLCEQKGQLLLLDAVAKLRDHGLTCTMLLAGDGPLRSMIERRIQDLKLEQHVRITGWVTGQQIRQMLIESRALVLPSFAEGLPVVLMEAMALGRPVITTFIAGIPELVENGISGWLIPAGSMGALVNAMQELLKTDQVRLNEMGRQGADAVRRLHNIADETAKLAALFDCPKG